MTIICRFVYVESAVSLVVEGNFVDVYSRNAAFIINAVIVPYVAMTCKWYDSRDRLIATARAAASIWDGVVPPRSSTNSGNHPPSEVDGNGENGTKDAESKVEEGEEVEIGVRLVWVRLVVRVVANDDDDVILELRLLLVVAEAEVVGTTNAWTAVIVAFGDDVFDNDDATNTTNQKNRNLRQQKLQQKWNFIIVIVSVACLQYLLICNLLEEY